MGRKPCCNPYSTAGLDKFDSLNAKLGAKREHVARKRGIPEDMVRFAHTSKGWVPLVLNYSLTCIETEQDNQKREKYIGESNEECVKDDDEKHDDGVNGSFPDRRERVPWWCGYLKTTAFGLLTVTAILVGNLAVTARAMGLLMLGLPTSLQRLWSCGVMCMKSFIDTGISYFSHILKAEELIKPIFCDRFEDEPTQEQGGPLLDNKDSEDSRVSDPKINSRGQELNTQQKEKKKKKSGVNNKKFQGQARKSSRLQQSGSFSRRAASGENDVTVGATLMIILLFFLVVYGRICAICLTSALLYVVPRLRVDGSSDASTQKYDAMFLQSKEYRKKVIMDGLLARNH